MVVVARIRIARSALASPNHRFARASFSVPPSALRRPWNT
jgi:hypothetical protein